MDPGAGSAETRANQEYARQGLPVRACLHADSTLESTTDEHGRRIVVRTCDYCPSLVFGISGYALPGMAPWIYRTD